MKVHVFVCCGIDFVSIFLMEIGNVPTEFFFYIFNCFIQLLTIVQLFSWMSVLLVDETRVPKEKYIFTDFELHCYLT